MFNLTTQVFQAFATDVFAVLLDAAIKSSVLLLAALTICRLLRQRSAASRHIVWSLAVALALSMPLLSRLVPAVEVPLPYVPIIANDADGLTVTRVPVVTDSKASAARGPGLAAENVVADSRTAPAASPLAPSSAEGRASGPDEAISFAPSSVTTSPPSFSDSRVGVAQLRLPTLLLGLWAVGAAFVITTLLIGMARLHWIARRAVVITTGRLWVAARRMARRTRLEGTLVILQGDDAAIPMTWGLRRSFILLPAGAEDWADWRLDTVLVHELGHIRRRDYLSQTAAQFASAIYWFNPLIWIAAHRMRVEREHACDDVVVSAGHEPSSYAKDLLSLARSFPSRDRAGSIALAMARPNHLRGRLMAILDESRNRHPITRRRVFGAAVAALAVASAVATLTPAGAEANELDEPRDVSRSSERIASVASPTTSESGNSSQRAPAIRATGTQPAAEPIEIAVPKSFMAALRFQDATVLCGPADGEARRRQSMSDDGRRVVEAEFGDCRSVVRIEGDLDFTDDFSGITRLSSDGFLRIEVNRDGSRRRLEARPGDGGRPDYTWSIDGQNQTFDAAAERWLASALLDVFRSSSYMAQERAEWILSTQGSDGVLAEVERMESDHAQATYLSILIAEGDLSTGDVRNVIEVAGRELESDHSLGTFLVAMADTYPFDPATQSAFLEAAASLESDHQQGRVFQTALARDDLTSQNVELLLRTAAQSIESDHTLGQLLLELATRYPLDAELRQPFLDAAASLESDHMAGQVYGVVLSQPGLRPTELAAVLEAATDIDSDHTLGQLLQRAAQQGLSDATLRGAFLRTAASIQSDHTLAMVYGDALALIELSDSDMATIFDGLREIESDHQLSTLLRETAERGLAGSTLQRAFLNAASRIGSDHNLSETLRAFLRMDGVGEEEQVGLLRAAQTIESDHSLAELLLEFVNRFPVEGAVRSAFMRVLDQIESQHQHGRVSSALVERQNG